MIYKFVRNTHLIMGLLALPMILVYALSSVQMAHRIRGAQKVTVENVALSPALTPRAAARQLMDRRGFSGDVGEARTTAGGIAFEIARTGTRYAVTYDPTAGSARVRITDTGVWGELNRLHHLHGFNHGNAAMNAWAWVLALVSIVLLSIGATGLYMWFKLYKERLIGSILLSANLIVSIVLLSWLRS